MTRLRKVQLKEGKFILEGKVVEADVLKLGFLGVGWDSADDFAPKDANAYYTGKPAVLPANYKLKPILYIKIKDQTPSQ